MDQSPRNASVVYEQAVEWSAIRKNTTVHWTHPRCWERLRRLGQGWRGVAAFCSERHLGMRGPAAGSGPPQGPGSRRMYHLHPLNSLGTRVFGLQTVETQVRLTYQHCGNYAHSTRILHRSLLTKYITYSNVSPMYQRWNKVLHNAPSRPRIHFCNL